MILQALTRYYEVLAREEKVSRKGWCTAKVSYAVNLSKEGKIRGIFCLKTEETRGKKTIIVPDSMRVPEMVSRSSGVAANFLCDNAKYFLGIDREMEDNNKKCRALECFHAAREKHLLLLDGVKGEMAQAIRLYFENWEPEKAAENEEIKEIWDDLTDGGNLIFCMGMKWAQEDADIKNAWEESQKKSGEETAGICLVTGQKSPIARIHKTIKGVPGAQSSGAALVSFNAQAFESYGKEQSYNAPVGKYAEFAYTTALNYLLSQKEYTFLLGDTMMVFWVEKGEEIYQKTFLEFLNPVEDNEDKLKDIFKKLREGRPIVVENINLNADETFYILGLAPNAARLSIRLFYRDSFGNILENISKHYKRMEMVRPAWETREYLGIWQMMWETVNQKAKDKKPVSNMASMVMQAIISGGRYPASLFTDTLMRIKTEQGKISWGRAGIIKAYLIKNCNWKEGENYMGLNEASEETSYVLGRLFSVLECIQIEANPGIKSTIRDRYFNAACATPASVFPILIKLKNSHIKKIEREKESAKRYYENLLMEIIGKLGEEYPKRLSLEEQGKFTIGYYHQMQKKYEKKGEKTDERND